MIFISFFLFILVKLPVQAWIEKGKNRLPSIIPKFKRKGFSISPLSTVFINKYFKNYISRLRSFPLIYTLLSFSLWAEITEINNSYWAQFINILFKIFGAVFLSEINFFFLLGFAGTTKRGGGLAFFFHFLKEFTYKRWHYFPLNIWLKFTHEIIWAYSFLCGKVFKLWIQVF